MPYKNKQKQQEAQHNSYVRNRELYVEKKVRDRKKKRSYIQELKKVACMDCHNFFPPYAMDFDHREGEDKKMGVAELCNFSWARLLAEIEKCDIICSNCHRGRTYKRGYRK